MGKNHKRKTPHNEFIEIYIKQKREEAKRKEAERCKNEREIQEKTEKRKESKKIDDTKEQQVIEQIKEKRQKFKKNIKEAASQFDKKVENHYEIIAAQDAVMKRQIDYLKAAYKLEEKQQEDERAF